MSYTIPSISLQSIRESTKSLVDARLDVICLEPDNVLNPAVIIHDSPLCSIEDLHSREGQENALNVIIPLQQPLVQLLQDGQLYVS